MDRKQPRLWQGLALFAAIMAIMIFICAPIQYYYGIWGLAITELILLAVTLAAARIAGVSFRATFPLAPPPLRVLAAALSFYIGAYLFMLTVTAATAYFFPEMNDVSDAIIGIGTQAGPFYSVLIMAILPAICEETLHRGFILSSFNKVKSRALTAVLMGLIFGLFHLDPYRFLPTAILGGVFSYIALVTGSMALPMLFHFFNNLVSVVAMYLVEIPADGFEAQPLPEILPMQLAGSIMLYLGAALMFGFVGWRSLAKPKLRGFVFPLVIAASSVLIVGGMAVSAASVDWTEYMNGAGEFLVGLVGFAR